MDKHDDQWLEQVYRESFPQVAAWVRQQGGDLAAAKDLFHDAMIVYLEKRSDPSFAIRTSDRSYIHGIAKILWIKKIKAEKGKLSMDAIDEELASEETPVFFKRKKIGSLVTYMQMAGKKCMDILQSFYYDNLSMQQIAEKFNFSTPHSATVQKYKCLEKLREQIKHSDLYEEATA